tara:strand:- start:645 stop:911 length:267 start_codon:yes stop_codon:yes gene_type:complete
MVRSPIPRTLHGGFNPCHIVAEETLPDLVRTESRRENVGQSVIETAEHNAAACQGLKRRQAKTFTNSRTPPMLGGVIDIDGSALKQAH